MQNFLVFAKCKEGSPLKYIGTCVQGVDRIQAYSNAVKQLKTLNLMIL